MTITPSTCIQCKLCENSCPFGAIEVPDSVKLKETKSQTKKRFISFLIIIPILTLLGIWTGYQFHENLAMVNSKVKLASTIYELENDPSTTLNPSYIETVEVEAFKSSGTSIKELYIEANSIIDQFKIGAMWLGAFIGLVFGITLAGLSVFKYREDYEPNKGTCLSCARCMDYCPVGDSNELIIKNNGDSNK